MKTQPRKIPLWRFVIDAHRLLWRDRVAVARFAAPWFLLLIIADAVVSWTYFPHSQQQETASTWPDILHVVTALALTLVIGSIVAVLLHRHILLPDDSIGRGRPSAPSNLVAAYMGRTFAMQFFFFGQISLAAFVIVVSADFLGSAEQFVAETSTTEFWTASGLVLAGSVAVLIIPASYIPVRISLALPATAIGNAERTFGTSWLLTRGNFWRLFCGGILCNWPFWLLMVYTLSSFTAETQTELQFIGDATATTVVICISDLIWVAFFSLSYRHLSTEHEPASPLPSTQQQ